MISFSLWQSKQLFLLCQPFKYKYPPGFRSFPNFLLKRHHGIVERVYVWESDLDWSSTLPLLWDLGKLLYLSGPRIFHFLIKDYMAYLPWLLWRLAGFQDWLSATVMVQALLIFWHSYPWAQSAMPRCQLDMPICISLWHLKVNRFIISTSP